MSREGNLNSVRAISITCVRPGGISRVCVLSHAHISSAHAAVAQKEQNLYVKNRKISLADETREVCLFWSYGACAFARRAHPSLNVRCAPAAAPCQKAYNMICEEKSWHCRRNAPAAKPPYFLRPDQRPAPRRGCAHFLIILPAARPTSSPTKCLK